MKTLKVHNYEILNFDNEPLIYTKNGITRITDQSLANALHEIIKHKDTEIPLDNLISILERESIQTESAMTFLESISVLGEIQKKPHFQKVNIYCDWPNSNEISKHIKNISKGKMEIFPLTDNALLSEKKDSPRKPTLFLFALSKLNPKELREQYYKITKAHPSCGISIGFLSGNHFHITEPYIPNIKNPCSFCTIDRIIYYETHRTSQHPWSRLLAFCDSTGISLPRRNIDELQKALILGALIKLGTRFTTLQQNKSTQDKALRSLTINLENGTLSEDPSVHWPLCKCMEN